MPLTSINPYNLTVNKEVREDDREQVLAKIELAQKAFAQWKHTSFENRRMLMTVAAGHLQQRKQELARLVTLEMGKPIKEAITEIEKCASTCLFYAQKAESFLQPEWIDGKAKKQCIDYSPLGVILAVMPWNFPFWQVFRFAAPTLMAGNTALLKHASNVPMCSEAIEQVFVESGFPVGVFQSLLIGSDKLPAVIAHDAVKAVTLTGSEKAGAEVASLAAKHIKKSVLELGGNDAFIVLADAPLESTAAMAVKSRMINTGQSCIAAKRIIVEAAVYERFIEHLAKCLRQLKTGDPIEPDTDIGPVARMDLLDGVLEQVNKTVTQGARLVYGGKKLIGHRSLMEPVLLADVVPGMLAFEDEIFGPVVSVIKAKDAQEAVYLANLSRFGLGASIWTPNLPLAQSMSRQLDAGFVAINRIVASDPNLPFGGIKKSGFGRELSYHGIREFTNIKTIILE